MWETESIGQASEDEEKNRAQVTRTMLSKGQPER